MEKNTWPFAIVGLQVSVKKTTIIEMAKLNLRLLIFTVISLFTLAAISANNKVKTPAKKEVSFVREAGSYPQLDSILLSNGFTQTEATNLLRQPSVPQKWHLNPKDKFLVTKNGGRTEVHFYLEYSDDALIFWKSGKEVGLEKKSVIFNVLRKVIEAPIMGSLTDSIKKIVNDEWVVNRFSDAFVWDLDLNKKLKQKDRFKFVLEQKYAGGHLVKNGEILEAELRTNGQTYKRVLLVKDGKKVFVDPERLYEDRPFYSPVDYAHVTSLFSRKRFHPIRHRYVAHEGIDYALQEGSSVYAAQEGVIIEAAKKRGNGNYVMIAHPDGSISYYNHLQSHAQNINPGQRVLPGTVIGYVGCSGLCTSPHLHFAIKKGGRMIDPIKITKPFPYFAKDYRETDEYKNLLSAYNDSLHRGTASARP